MNPRDVLDLTMKEVSYLSKAASERLKNDKMFLAKLLGAKVDDNSNSERLDLSEEQEAKLERARILALKRVQNGKG